ncbi:hypothetical protein C8Q74DRAFT_1373038 [Fomes fomentarius]|nr:hypothetical protein C8Q74DRAFT_1373038 [Fomes fomentarius]
MRRCGAGVGGDDVEPEFGAFAPHADGVRKEEEPEGVTTADADILDHRTYLKTGILDLDTLRNCTLVSSGWRPRAQTLLFQTILITNLSDAHKLASLLDVKPDLRNAIRRLVICVPYDRDAAPGLHFNSSHSVALLFPSLFLGRMPNLTYLKLEIMGMSERSSEPGDYLDIPFRFYMHLGRLTHITTLHLHDLVFRYFADLVRILCAVPELRSNGANPDIKIISQAENSHSARAPGHIRFPGFDMMHLSNLTELTFLVSPAGMKHLSREDRETLVTFLRLSLMHWNPSAPGKRICLAPRAASGYCGRDDYLHILKLLSKEVLERAYFDDRPPELDYDEESRTVVHILITSLESNHEDWWTKNVYDIFPLFAQEDGVQVNFVDMPDYCHWADNEQSEGQSEESADEGSSEEDDQ